MVLLILARFRSAICWKLGPVVRALETFDTLWCCGVGVQGRGLGYCLRRARWIGWVLFRDGEGSGAIPLRLEFKGITTVCVRVLEWMRASGVVLDVGAFPVDLVRFGSVWYGMVWYGMV